MNTVTFEELFLDAFAKASYLYAGRPLLLAQIATVQSLFIQNKDLLAADLTARGYALSKGNPPPKEL